jgi:preprotein translocase subunit SecF
VSRIGTLGHQMYTGELSYDFVGRWRRWFLVSTVIILVALGGVLFRGMNFSIEFRGGVDMQVPAAAADSKVQPVIDAVQATGIPAADEPVVTAIGGNKIRVQTQTLTPDQAQTVRTAVAKTVGAPVGNVAYSSIGPSWGKQISQKAILSLLVFLVLVVLVIWAYFREIRMSIAAIVALLHDLLITVGIYALVGFTVTPGTVIGVLTILGYSLYDTVVVFDKVRENTGGLLNGARSTYSEAANLAVNQTLVRSINTSVASLLPVAGILFVGAGLLGVGTLEDLALALFVGIAAGTYSSVFVATPLLALLKERDPAFQALARRVASRRAQSAARAASAVQDEDAPLAQPHDPAVAVAGHGYVASGPRQQPVRRPRSQRRGGRPGQGGTGR